MSLRRFPFATIAAAALSVTIAGAAVAGPWALAPGEYYTELRGSFFSSATFYDNDGNRMPVGGLFEQRALTSYTELGWKKRVSFQMGMPALSQTQRQGGSAASVAGFGDLAFGLRYSLANGPGAAAVQLDWRTPSGYNDKLTPALGTGMQRLGLSLELGRALGKSAFLQAGGGYAYDYVAIGARSTDPLDNASKRRWADHVTAHAALGVWMGRLQVAGLYEGELASQSGLDVETTSHLFGTRFAYRVDERLDAVAGSWHTPGGENVLHVDQYFAGVAWKVTKLNRLQGFLGGDKRP